MGLFDPLHHQNIFFSATSSPTLFSGYATGTLFPGFRIKTNSNIFRGMALTMYIPGFLSLSALSLNPPLLSPSFPFPLKTCLSVCDTCPTFPHPPPPPPSKGENGDGLRQNPDLAKGQRRRKKKANIQASKSSSFPLHPPSLFPYISDSGNVTHPQFPKKKELLRICRRRPPPPPPPPPLTSHIKENKERKKKRIRRQVAAVTASILNAATKGTDPLGKSLPHTHDAFAYIEKEKKIEIIIMRSRRRGGGGKTECASDVLIFDLDLGWQQHSYFSFLCEIILKKGQFKILLLGERK